MPTSPSYGANLRRKTPSAAGTWSNSTQSNPGLSPPGDSEEDWDWRGRRHMVSLSSSMQYSQGRMKYPCATQLSAIWPARSSSLLVRVAEMHASHSCVLHHILVGVIREVLKHAIKPASAQAFSVAPKFLLKWRIYAGHSSSWLLFLPFRI